MYQAQITRQQPSAFIFMVDQSGSMDEKINGIPLNQLVADSLNNMISDLVIKCSKAEGIRDYFDLAVIGYGNNKVYNGFQGALGSDYFHPISRVGNNPLRLDETVRIITGPNGDTGEQITKRAVWFEPKANGGTPMHAAYNEAAHLLADWCDHNMQSFPPVLINITDGESTDEDPEDIAQRIMGLRTDDGNVMVYNLHLSSHSSSPVLFADEEPHIGDEFAAKLWRMSSKLTPLMEELALKEGFDVTPRSRGYAYNADMASVISFMDIGTRATRVR